ncbi:MAG: ElyC/SanA/YdcF family protein [bacterium]
MKKKILTRSAITLTTIAAIVLISLFLSDFIITSNTKKLIYSDLQNIPPAYTGLVLGAQVYADGTLSDMLLDRVETGMELYKAGKIKKLIMSGDHGKPNYDEVNAMRRYALEKGVPAEDLFMDHAGFDTYDSFYRARDVFQITDVIIITQAFHLPRAVYIANKLGLKATGIIADKRGYGVYEEKAEFREQFANIKALLDVHIFHSKPTYLGNPIPITGDGQTTLD